MHRCLFINALDASQSRVYALEAGAERHSFVELRNNECAIPFNDRAFNYGDGHFTTIAVQCLNNELSITALDTHINRLAHDSSKLKIALDAGQVRKQLEDCMYFMLSQSVNDGNYVVKVVVSRGAGGRGYGIQGVLEPSVYISLQSRALAQSQVNTIGVCETRLAKQPLLAGVKHLNRLEQVLAKIEISQRGWHDGLILDTHSNIIEASSANVFMRIGHAWVSPLLNDCGVSGVMRSVLLDYFNFQKVEVIEREVAIDELSNVSSLFLCNSLHPMLAVSEVELDGKTLKMCTQSCMMHYDPLCKYIKTSKTTVMSAQA